MIGYKKDLQDDTFYCDIVLRDVFTNMENVYGDEFVVAVFESGENDFYEESVYVNHFLTTCFEV